MDYDIANIAWLPTFVSHSLDILEDVWKTSSTDAVVSPKVEFGQIAKSARVMSKLLKSVLNGNTIYKYGEGSHQFVTLLSKAMWHAVSSPIYCRRCEQGRCVAHAKSTHCGHWVYLFCPMKQIWAQWGLNDLLIHFNFVKSNEELDIMMCAQIRLARLVMHTKSHDNLTEISVSANSGFTLANPLQLG